MNRVIFLLALASLFFTGCYYATTGYEDHTGQPKDPEDWATVTGHVYFKDTGEPASGASVYLETEGSSLGSYADESGFYRIGAGTGTYWLTASRLGYEQYRQRVTIQNNRSYTYDIYLVPSDSNQVVD